MNQVHWKQQRRDGLTQREKIARQEAVSEFIVALVRL